MQEIADTHLFVMCIVASIFGMIGSVLLTMEINIIVMFIISVFILSIELFFTEYIKY